MIKGKLFFTIITENNITIRFYFVDWGFKFPARCEYRRKEVDEIPDFENFPPSEQKRIRESKQEMKYSKIENVTSSIFNEHFAETSKYRLYCEAGYGQWAMISCSRSEWC